jgi:hypothetical protein
MMTTMPIGFDRAYAKLRKAEISAVTTTISPGSNQVRVASSISMTLMMTMLGATLPLPVHLSKLPTTLIPLMISDQKP